MAKFNLEKLTMWLVIIGAINWGTAELGYNLVQMTIGAFLPSLVSIVYYVVGASGVYQLYLMLK